MGVNLSVREHTCLSLVAQGKSSWDIGGILEIGEILEISENTVNFHRKLQTTSRTLAAIKAANGPRTRMAGRASAGRT